MRTAALVSFSAAVLIAITLFSTLTHQLPFQGDDRIILTGVIALLLAALLHRPLPIVLLLIFELGNCGQYNPGRDVTAIRNHPSEAAQPDDGGVCKELLPGDECQRADQRN